jgi:exopolysaccharide production protein ExoZ
MTVLRQRLARLFGLDGGGERIHSMEGLRGFAVLLVFLVHYEAIFGRWLGAAGTNNAIGAFLEKVGHTGVDLFFVLSGYFIYGATLKDRAGYAQFMRRRIRRIYPTFAAMFVIYLGLSGLLPDENKLPPGHGAAALYVLENALFLPGMVRITPIITVAWSLSYEVFYYALIPLLVALFALRRWSPGPRVLFFVGIAGAFAVRCFLGGQHVQLLLFVSGILVYEASRSEAITRIARGRGAQAVALVALALYLPVCFRILTLQASWLPEASSRRYSLQACWLFAALFWVVLVAFVAEGPLRSIFSVAPLRWLGNMSYSYYLMHALTLKAFGFLIARACPSWHPGAAAHWALLPVALAATLVTSAVLFCAVEKPFSLAPKQSAASPRIPVPLPAAARAVV